MKKAMRVTGNIVTVLLIIFIMFLAVMTVSSRVSGGEPNIFGHRMMTVLSGSMKPTFDPGSIIFMKEVKDTTTLKAGDIITFQSTDGKVITHRIKEVVGSEESTSYVTKGDNNNTVDEENVLPTNISAKYEGITIPYVGFLLSYASSKVGSALLLIIPGLCFILYATISVWDGLKSLDKQQKLEV